MNNNNLQQWWENTYRHHYQHLQQQQQQDTGDSENDYTFDSTNEFLQYSSLKQKLFPFPLNGADGSVDITPSSSLSSSLSSSPVGGILSTIVHGYSSGVDVENFTLTNLYGADSDRVMEEDENAIPPITLLLMAISFGLVVFGGVLGNATLVLTLCSASSVRLRNPLLLAVCIADLLVTGISAPVTLLNLAMNRKTNSLPLVVCKVIHYVQVMPVAASTISFFMLSLDRYATVKHPRLAQLRQRRYLHVTLALVSWVTSALISVPFLFAYRIIAKSIIIRGNTSHGGAAARVVGSHGPADILRTVATTVAPAIATTHMPSVSVSCTSDLGPDSSFASFIIFHTVAVFIIPGFGVLLNHYGVRRKLCALSLTARAAHGELPLPMPILRRQTHMVIVTGLANAQECGATTDDTSNGGDIQLHNLNPATVSDPPDRDVIKSSNPISPRAMREIRAHSQRQRISNNQGAAHGPATPGIPLPLTSTLRSRRRLANVLVASAFIFIACWAPHVFCIFYTNFGLKQYCSKTSNYFHLLLGYFYSAISPVIYWALNHNTLRQSPCAPIIRLRSMQNFLRTRFRSHTIPPPPPSSTNEAALGAFNPKLIKLTPKQYRAQASSHYLY